jgi:hypothetical protein
MCHDIDRIVGEDHLVVGDLEGLCQVPFKEGYLYLALEYPPTILEMNEANDKVGVTTCHNN